MVMRVTRPLGMIPRLVDPWRNGKSPKRRNKLSVHRTPELAWKAAGYPDPEGRPSDFTCVTLWVEGWHFAEADYAK